MIGIDTNLLIRHLTQDDPGQSAKVEALFDETERRGDAVWIGQVVLCETCWVLASVYRFGKTEIAAGLRSLLEDGLFNLEGRAMVEAALRTYLKEGGQFADHLIGIRNAEAGATTTYTFDRQAGKLPGFTRLG